MSWHERIAEVRNNLLDHPEPGMMTLRQLREQGGGSQADVAYALRVTPQTVYNWEVGTREPKARHLQQLARLFACPAELIFIPPPKKGKQGEGKED